MKSLLKISIFIFFCTLSLQVNAQLPTPIDGVTIETDISNPKPGQAVEVSVESFTFDLGGSSIVWSVNGKVQDQGVGMKSIEVTAPKVGARTNVLVSIKGADGREIQKSITIKSGYVDMIWESNGYKPPFFQGKAPYAFQNTVKLIAIPHLSKDGNQEIDPKTLVYTWKNDGKYVEGGQGYGKQSIVIPGGDLPKSLEISVEISNREQTEHTMGNITLEPTDPSLSFYEEDSLYGILFNRALIGNIQLKNTEMKILSVPYGFNLQNKDNTYTWSINGFEQPDLIKNRSIIVRSKGDTGGSSSIGLDIRNQDDILQGAREGFTVYFNKRQNETESVF